ncbi:hypothetical protein A3C18_01040 [Candidatus Kaiserbacteria bacterium RIFCSPHIGHO2_02_FULL_54_11b]|uniref:Toxin YoeB n=2 Tax=Candidatus Kaiseribacteriota TaxID=1752734 RepID=A0A1F6CL98_9BACT|nr:MAG: hypothetical protein A2704_06985 [Candidatus Kaiserbacteria bacterium RIFCSPHIGHO2_01_FULL_54_36b]OGG63880.1 MAG: hypothetical protein A3C18_01040 [Candidatus Kaiserbacteria bacterium RIFCSPHIGHO2_02_FULL_54_11b]
MIELIITDEFAERYRALPASIQRKLEKQERLFRENPFHPSLHTEKLEPRARQYWSFRVDRTYRVLFRFLDGQTVALITVGTHDWVYRLHF